MSNDFIFDESLNSRHLEPKRHIHKTLASARRHLGIVFSFTLFGTVLAAAVALTAPRYYAAKVQMEVLSNNSANNIIDEGIIDSHLAMLGSDAQVRSVVNSLEPDNKTNNLAETEKHNVYDIRSFIDHLVRVASYRLGVSGSESKTNKTFDSFIGSPPTFIELKNSVKMYQERRSHIITIQYSNEVPEEAARIANRYAEVYLERLLQRGQHKAQTKLDYLKARISEISTAVTRAETAVQMYKLEHDLRDTNQLDLSSLSEIKRQLPSAHSEWAAGQTALAEIRGQMAKPNGADTVSTTTTSLSEHEPSLGELERKVQRAEEQVQGLERQFVRLQQSLRERARDWVQLRLLDRQAASATQLLQDLLRSQQEVTEHLNFPQLDVEIVAPAIVPVRVSTPNPVYFVPAAVVCFLLLGIMAAQLRGRVSSPIDSDDEAEKVLGSH